MELIYSQLGKSGINGEHLVNDQDFLVLSFIGEAICDPFSNRRESERH